MRRHYAWLAVGIVALALTTRDAGAAEKGMLVSFPIDPQNPKVLSTQNISLPKYDLAYRPIGDLPAKCAYFPVDGLGFDEQFVFLNKITKDIPFVWKEKETHCYLVFKCRKIKKDTYLVGLNKSHPLAKNLDEIADEDAVYLPTTYAADQAIKDSELFKSLAAQYNKSVAKEIWDWIVKTKVAK